MNLKKISVVIPCYRVKNHILAVIEGIGQEVSTIYVIDDFCPEFSGDHVGINCVDRRVIVLRNNFNLGVGGSVMVGYKRALKDGADVIVKIDGDGQMDPSLLMRFASPIISGVADYCKGNRFYDLEGLNSMPKVRLLGNAGLSFIAKFSTGYWNLFDPTNGYTAISREVASRIPYEKISKRYFFETDILFRLNLLRAVAVDIPMTSIYSNEVSNLRIKKIFFEFLYKNFRNYLKRIFYNYYLRDMSVASIELPLGICLFGFGLIYGLAGWWHSSLSGSSTPVGTIMLSSVTILTGIQFLLAFINYDIGYVPTKPISKLDY
ncbi:putative glycosyltransferase [Polynucleobacter duraquae]|uniref:Glycosyltransferase n=1 Tax=Polynucleobacter duraquae TaxID=1835254 RepID=A0A0E3ZIT2_9BURK|nr:glycosyltransferase family 2 protein [Polynucleobacter duraquae]AKD24671.1 putative glycosyltransferase [Polynucleobacter duraquae]